MDGFAHTFGPEVDPSEEAVDLWLRTALRHNYDAVLDEDLPADLADLLSPAPPPARSRPG